MNESSSDYYLFTGLQSLDSLSTRMLEVSTLTLKLNKSTNKRLPQEDGVFSRVFYRNSALLHLRVLLSLHH